MIIKEKQKYLTSSVWIAPEAGFQPGQYREFVDDDPMLVIGIKNCYGAEEEMFTINNKKLASLLVKEIQEYFNLTPQ